MLKMDLLRVVYIILLYLGSSNYIQPLRQSKIENLEEIGSVENGDISKNVLPSSVEQRLGSLIKLTERNSHMDAEKILKKKYVKKVITAVINQYADKVLKKVSNLIVKSEMDPLKLGNTNLSTYFGKVDLSGGWLQKLSTLTRNHDISSTYESLGKIFEVNVSLKFDELKCTYNYTTNSRFLRTSGQAIGIVKNINVFSVIKFDFKTFLAELTSFEIARTGSVTVTFTGYKWAAAIMNAMSKAAMFYIQPTIIRTVQELIQNNLKESVEEFNKANQLNR